MPRFKLWETGNYIMLHFPLFSSAEAGAWTLVGVSAEAGAWTLVGVSGLEREGFWFAQAQGSLGGDLSG